MLIIVVCSLLAAGAAAGGAVYFMSGKKEGEAHAEAEAAPAIKTPAIYSKFDPPFVVNFQNKGQSPGFPVSHPRATSASVALAMASAVARSIVSRTPRSNSLENHDSARQFLIGDSLLDQRLNYVEP